jgi:hypothetical protein
MRKFVASATIAVACLLPVFSAQAITLNITGLPGIDGTLEGSAGESAISDHASEYRSQQYGDRS